MFGHINLTDVVIWLMMSASVVVLMRLAVDAGCVVKRRTFKIFGTIIIFVLFGLLVFFLSHVSFKNNETRLNCGSLYHSL